MLYNRSFGGARQGALCYRRGSSGRTMRVVKAVAVREPWASQIAAGATAIAFKSFRTPYRGEILIVSDEEPWYGLALAELVDVQPITREMDAPLQRGYGWRFQNVMAVTGSRRCTAPASTPWRSPRGRCRAAADAGVPGRRHRRWRTKRPSRSRSPVICGWHARASAARTAASASCRATGLERTGSKARARPSVDSPARSGDPGQDGGPRHRHGAAGRAVAA